MIFDKDFYITADYFWILISGKKIQNCEDVELLILLIILKYFTKATLVFEVHLQLPEQYVQNVQKAVHH